MEEKRCPLCGSVLPEDAKHCPECGANLKDAAAAAAAAEAAVETAAGEVAPVAQNAAETISEGAEKVIEAAEEKSEEAADEIRSFVAEEIPAAPAPAYVPNEAQQQPPATQPVAETPAVPYVDPNLEKERQRAEEELQRAEKERQKAEKERQKAEKERAAAEKEAKKEQARQEAIAKAKAKEERRERLANREPLTEDDVWRTPYQPVSPWGWIGRWLLLAIPVVGFVLSIVWACGGTKRKTVQNYCIALWIVVLVCAIILIAAFVAIWIITGNPIEWFQNTVRELGSAMSSI